MNRNSKRPQNTVYPTKALRVRTAEEWERVIRENVPEQAQAKIAILVWWDHIGADGSNLTTSKWFRDHLDNYQHSKHDLKKKDLFECLVAVGYPEKTAKAKRPASAAINARAEAAERKREQRRMIHED